MNPYAELYQTALACMGPLLAALSGSFLLGGLTGWLFSPGPRDGTPAIRAELARLRLQVVEAGEKLALSGSLEAKRWIQKEAEVTEARRALENEVSTLHGQVTSLKMALVAAKRVVPGKQEAVTARTPVQVVPDPVLIARIAQLEKETVRIPVLLHELEELRSAIPKPGKKTAPAAAATGPLPLPKNVYRLISDSFGKRIAQNDLKLVLGIGPKIEAQFHKHGLKTWADVAATKPERLKEVLDQAGDHSQLHDPSTWPAQCRMMMEHRWDELRKYQRKLSNAR